MNLASWLIVAALITICALIIRSLRKKGGIVCDGGCSGCSCGCSCSQCNISGKSA